MVRIVLPTREVLTGQYIMIPIGTERIHLYINSDTLISLSGATNYPLREINAYKLPMLKVDTSE